MNIKVALFSQGFSDNGESRCNTKENLLGLGCLNYTMPVTEAENLEVSQHMSIIIKQVVPCPYRTGMKYVAATCLQHACRIIIVYKFRRMFILAYLR